MIKNKNDTDELTKSDLEKAEVLADYFRSVFIREPDGDITEETTICFNTIGTCTIDPLMVVIKLKKLKIYKSPGPGGLHPRVLNELADTINIPLSTIFKTSPTTGALPTYWKKANISAINKKGNKQPAHNYRPVSLTSVVGRSWRQSSETPSFNT